METSSWRKVIEYYGYFLWLCNEWKVNLTRKIIKFLTNYYQNNKDIAIATIFLIMTLVEYF